MTEGLNDELQQMRRCIEEMKLENETLREAAGKAEAAGTARTGIGNAAGAADGSVNPVFGDRGEFYVGGGRSQQQREELRNTGGAVGTVYVSGNVRPPKFDKKDSTRWPHRFANFLRSQNLHHTL